MDWQHTSWRIAVFGILGVVVLGFVTGSGHTMPFHPDVAEQLRAEGKLEEMVSRMEQARQAGFDEPAPSIHGWLRHPGERGRIPDRNAIVLLVDFSDNQADWHVYPTSHYDSLLFSVGIYPTGSMRDWYLENSYGTFSVTGGVSDWLRMPETYAYYVNGQAGMGGYPNNCQKMTEDAVLAADAFIDFSQYDNDGPDGIPNSGDDDGMVDALFVVHAGPGREETGSDDDVHSHASSTSYPVPVDGVTAGRYSTEPDNGKCGVFGHEFGHVLGLPDLYDTDYSSSGIGSWGMMSHGSWGNGGKTPVHFLAWSKARLGFLDPVTPLVNIDGVEIPQVETSPTAYRMWTGGYPDQQYFLVENRQRTGFDTYLPGDGLIISHVDESVSGNTNEAHPLVAVEQADGLEDLFAGRGSDDGDPWPGSTDNRNFTEESNPNSHDYADNPTQVTVCNISDSQASMTADLCIETEPILVFEDYSIEEVSGDHDGNLDPGEQWDLPVWVYNCGTEASQVSGTLTSAEPDVIIDADASDYGTIGAETSVVGTPYFRATLDVGSTCDGLAFTVQVQDQSRATFEVPLVVGINDSLNVFRWQHEVVTPGYGDQWHLSTYRNHTPGGSYAWKCGGAGGTDYDDNVDASLVTIDLPLATVEQLRFWHWMDAEEDTPRDAWDGGIIEASVDGGPWELITPMGGYSHTIIANSASPFPAGMPCFSGTTDWIQKRVPLTGLTGETARLRFRFGSDGYVTGEGWYLDDISIVGTLLSAVEDLQRDETSLFLAQPQPNPAAGMVVIRFVRPADQEASLKLLDVNGRCLKSWRAPAMSATGMMDHQVRWDGRLPDGRRADSGIYYLSLRSGVDTRCRQLLRVR
ncbi:M6 family metalloprotease domain-containing protein [Candidatus Eisenbacteria bacterium]|uniref:M6 family metalloprotease domain-containing protein n=1 Tax=Eiseniibacteriota bacterium TaxID=2212470 RepID=A0ABV6YJ46_UNCEI